MPLNLTTNYASRASYSPQRAFVIELERAGITDADVNWFQPPTTRVRCLERDQWGELRPTGDFWDDRPNYRTTAQAMFNFMRNNAGGHYSGNSLMNLLRASETDVSDMGDERRAAMPELITIGAPYSYDEETETKTGGPIAALAALPMGDRNDSRARILLVVAQEARRRGIGRRLLQTYVQNVNEFGVTYVHRNNAPGMQFAVAAGMVPLAVGRTGVVKLVNPAVWNDQQDYEFSAASVS